jgi:hypothetical protein
MRKELMIDLETMSIKSNAAIVSVGIVLMDMDQLKICTGAHYNVMLESSQEAGLHFDARTISWWLNQGQEARDSLWTPEPISLVDVIADITNAFYPDDSYPTWGNGAAFDNVIFRNACEAVGIPCPFVFYHDRCYRTMKTLFTEVPQPPRSESGKHNALNDAIHQAEHLFEIMRYIRSKNEPVRQDRTELPSH